MSKEYYHVSKDFSRGKYTDAGLLIFSKSVKTQMTGNPNFPNPVPTLDVLGSAIDAYELSLEKAKNGGKEATSLKNDKREALVSLLKSLATYVDTTSAGDRTMILSSGFETNRLPSPVGPLPIPTGLVVKAGIGRGAVEVSCDVYDGIATYLFECTEAPSTENSIWRKETSTKHKFVFTGLTEGKEYVFRVTYVGADPSRRCSEEVSTFVL